LVRFPAAEGENSPKGAELGAPEQGYRTEGKAGGDPKKLGEVNDRKKKKKGSRLPGWLWGETGKFGLGGDGSQTWGGKKQGKKAENITSTGRGTKTKE